MAAKIGILGETTVATIDTTTTMYTVPADKAARVRVLFMYEGDDNKIEYSIFIGSPGSEIHIHYNTSGAGIDLWSGWEAKATPDPALSMLSEDVGIQEKNGGIDIDGTNFTSGDWVCVTIPHDYYLSTGDTVKVRIASDTGTDHLCQVLGVEDDA